MQESERPIAIDLFAGAGGMTLGFEQAGFDVLLSVEMDPVHCAVHEFNFPFWKILCKSVVEVTGEEIRSYLSIENRDIDVVFGGPPCQGFSLMGKRILDDPRNSLVFHFLRIINELKPKYFVMENVAGLTIGQSKQILLNIIAQFKECNYKVKEDYQVLNAAFFGVPQNRKRLFLIGCRQELELPEYPHPITKPRKGRSLAKLLSHLEIPDTPTVWDAIGDLPEVERYSSLYRRDWVKGIFGIPSHYAEKLRSLGKSDRDYSYPRKYNSTLLTSSARTRHTQTSIDRFQRTKPGETEKISRFLKLDPEGICNTLRAGTPSSRGAHTSPRPIHPITPRCITVREAARLHSYPDWYRFHVTKWHGFRQIGNSVPPLLAKAIAAQIIKVLGVSPAQPQQVMKLGKKYLLQFDMSKAAAFYEVDPHIIKPRTKKIAA
ncbi:MAG: DNA cytosine methyltransferase [Cyanobacteria bacterium SBLK]|nr:DNA cytosine methyltransferase [Cyanobacteria bacterium SBLK]